MSVKTVIAQEWLGIAASRHSITEGMPLNPSSMMDSRWKFEYNFLGLNLHADNNYLYFDTTNIFKLKNDGNTLLLYNEFNQESPVDPDDLVLFDRTRENNKFMFFNMLIRGPSAIFRFPEHSLGFHTGLRTVFSMRGLHHSLAKFGYEGITDDFLFSYSPLQNTLHETKNSRVGVMSWLEAGISYARIIEENKFYRIDGGITVDYLIGLGGGYAFNKAFDYQVDPVNGNNATQDFTIEDLNGSYGYIDYNSYDFSDRGSLIKGGGAGTDIGVSYIQKNPTRPRYKIDEEFGIFFNDDPERYEWKLSAAIIDLGMIRFNKDAVSYRYEDGIAVWERVDTANINNPPEFDFKLASQFPDIQAVRDSGESFIMQLPTALSLQGDYNLSGPFYVSGLILQRIPILRAGVTRSNIIAVAPRYELRWFEVSMPMLFYEYTYLKLGLALRAAGFVIGTDHLGSFFGNGQLHGSDIYISFKMNLGKIETDFIARETPDYKKRMRKNNKKKKQLLPCIKW